MHIVYLTHQFFPKHIGGVEVYTLGLAKLASNAGHKVTVITHYESSSANPADFGPRYVEYEGIPIIEIHYKLGAAPRPAQYEYDNVFIGNILHQIFLNIKPDIVHVMHGMKLSASALNICSALEIPFIVTLCDYWFICPRHTLLKWDLSLCNGPVHALDCVKCVQELHGFARYHHLFSDLSPIANRKEYIKNALLKARRIIALSDFQKKMYAQNDIPLERIEVIRHGLEHFQGLDARASRIGPAHIGYIGSLVEHKGVHILLEAIKQIPAVDLTCKIYGTPETSKYVRRLHKITGNDKRIEFRETFSPAQLQSVIAELDILAVPSLWYENEPLVIKAALSVGVPTLCNNIGPLSDMIIHEKTGWLVPDPRVETWAVALQNAIIQAPQLHMLPVKIKTIEENAAEIFSIYAEETK